MTEQELQRLFADAKHNPDLKQGLIDTKSADDPLNAFCEFCREKGYDITIGGLLAAGQNANDAKLRSVNGGGVNAIDGWDDEYEQFFAELEWT